MALGSHIPGHRPNPALQPTASRARSLFFGTLAGARSRQLNANPLGRHHQRLSHCSELLCPSSFHVFRYDSLVLDLALPVDYTVECYPQYEVMREDHPNDDRS